MVTVLPNGEIWKSGGQHSEGKTAEEQETFVPLRSFVDKGIPFAIATDKQTDRAGCRAMAMNGD